MRNGAGEVEKVERLPVPELKETLSLYLRLVRPLLSDQDYEETKKIVTRFGAEEGKLLHERLLTHRETPGLINWLEPFWDEWYLCDDTPVVINVSPGLGLRMPSSHGLAETSQTGRASKLIRASLEWKALSESEPTRLLPELENGKPMCTFEFTRILCGTRVPHPKRDALEFYPSSKHIVVARRNRFFSLEVIDDSGFPYSQQEIEASIKEIMEVVDGEYEKERKVGIPLGAMTAGNRKLWAKNREELRQMNSRNWNSLARLESSILFLALDPESPPHTKSNEAARLFLHGDCQNRWFDKSIQLIVARNGISGICMEHSGFDGATLCRFANFITDFEDELIQRQPSNSYSIGPAFYELKFEAPTPVLNVAVEEANKLIKSLDLQVFHFKKFGKREIVKQKTSPDGFVQMAFQLSYRLLTGKTASTYESANTKRFAHGRTEAIRCVSVQSQAFVAAFLENPESQETASALRSAIDEHSVIARKCKQNKGVDRHLMGMRRMVFPYEPVPELFTNRAYPLLSRSVLSTSNLGSNKGVDLVCFGPVTDEGFGLCYMIHDHSLQIHVANFHGLSSSMASILDSCLVQMMALLSTKALSAKL